jgi:hypothetical protein
MAEDFNNPTTFNGSFPYQISTNLENGLWNGLTWENTLVPVSQKLRTIMDLYLSSTNQ